MKKAWSEPKLVKLEVSKTATNKNQTRYESGTNCTSYNNGTMGTCS